jgi:hypothetical protein
VCPVWLFADRMWAAASDRASLSVLTRQKSWSNVIDVVGMAIKCLSDLKRKTGCQIQLIVLTVILLDLARIRAGP